MQRDCGVWNAYFLSNCKLYPQKLQRTQGTRNHKVECDSIYSINLDFVFTMPLNGPSETLWKEFKLAINQHRLASSTLCRLFSVCFCNLSTSHCITQQPVPCEWCGVLSPAWGIARAPKTMDMATIDCPDGWTWANTISYYLGAGNPVSGTSEEESISF